ncbi:hypothetical protein B7767_22030 [Streptomyces sp. 13-12-16]|uniref:hypothetical protein n=1 Tax=Streptomyces sp. 13-12-16 TaxID=1570823 RepID=UPI000A1F508F|nr:hypothetical protein [Streptomyces sp. 13-12-16]OSP41228.1 hypothetical protein B7767_22030 [Streptomyces sp. 13-12-16]
MPTSSSARPPVPPTVWLARGRHAGATPETAIRHTLRWLKAGLDIDDFLELPAQDTAPDLVFEARTRVAGGVTVRARLRLAPGTDAGRDWVLVAEAEQPWDPSWPSPAAMFWPSEPDPGWNADPVTGLRPGVINPLPEDDKDVRRLLRACVRDPWHVHVVVHEAMTTDERGRVPLARWLPPGLRDRVVEHRATPQQSRVANWALREFGVEVPRGGAVVLPDSPAPEGYDADAFAVRAVFLDGTEPVDLVAAVTRYDALPRVLPEEAQDALTALREEWRLLTTEEELVRERALVAMYAEALEAMTKSRDLYREAAERAHEALAAYRESAGSPGTGQPPAPRAPSPLQHLTRTLERLKAGGRTRRPAPEDPLPEDPLPEDRPAASDRS